MTPEEVPVFVRRSRPSAGAGVRITPLDSAPASIDAIVEEFRNTAASRSGTARPRASMAAVTHLQVRSVEEYKLVLSSVRDGDTRSLIERDIELWNARDRESWLAGLDLHRRTSRRRAESG